MKTIKVNHSPATIFLRLFLLASFLISPLNANYAAQAKEPAKVVKAPALTPGNPLPRNETLYFNGQQWGSVNCWNPYSNNCNNAMAITQQDNARVTMFETPYIFNMLTGEQFPLLAEGPFTWNAAHTEITFRIKPAAHWSDGTPVTAYDVAYTWETNNRYGTAGSGYQVYIEAIEASDSQTVVVKAKLDGYGRAVNPLMVAAYLSTNYVIQKNWTLTLEARTGGDIQSDPGDDVVYSGPYHKFFADNSIVVLIRDDNYWGQDASMWGKLPAPKYLAHIIYPDNATSANAFLAGAVDVSQQFNENVQDLWLNQGLPISTYLPEAPYNIGASLPTAFYNLNSPGLDQVAIRKAIAIAVNYDKVVADAMTNQSATFAQVPRSLMNPTAGEQALYDHDAVASLQWTGNDIEGAKALLDAAGIVDTEADDDGWREYNGQNLHYVATCPNGWLDWQRAIEVVAAAGREIGIDITTNYPEWSPDYQNAVTNWPLPTSGYDIFLMWSDGSGPTQPWGRIHKLIGSDYAGSQNNWSGNWGGYINPAANALIRAIPVETDPVTLKEYYTELTEIYLTDIPSFTLMYRPQSFHTVNESVWTGFPKSGDGTNPPVPPLECTDGYSIACLYNLTGSPNPPNLEDTFISADTGGNTIYGYMWPMDAQMDLTITDAVGTEIYHHSGTVQAGPWWWVDDPGGTVAIFHLENGFDLLPGHIITLEGDEISKSYTVTNYAITEINTETNTLSGIGTVGASVTICSDSTPGPCRYVTVDGSGNWIAPDDPIEPATFLLQAGSFGWSAEHKEGSRDETYASWHVPNPRFDVRANTDQVEAYEWTVGELVTLTAGEYSETKTVGIASWDSNTTYVVFDLAGKHDIQPGDTISLSNSIGIIIKTTVVTDLEFTAIDVDADTVTGQAGSDSRVNIWACDSTHCSNRHINAENSSSWTVDFRTLGDEGNEQDTVDIINGTWIDSQQFDNDSDATMYGMNVVYPFITVTPSGHWIDGWNWPLGTQVTLTIGDYTSTAEMVGNPSDPIYFALPDNLDLMPGDVVTMSGDGKTKVLIVTNFAVTDMNEETNTILGTASPNGPVIACADNAPGGCRFATADEKGFWSMPADPNGFVVTPGVVGWAAETDLDGDETRMDWWANQFTTHVSSINRLDGNPTTTSSVRFDVTFSKPVTGVDASDFSLTSNGVYWAAITGVTGSEAEYTVTVRTGFGNGTLRLNLIDNGSITDMNGGHLVGLHSYNGDFTNGQSYAILRPDGTLPRAETLYFNGQQWGSVNCWNPYSNNCNNAMAITQQDNARVTVFETPYVFNMLDGKVYPLLAEGPWSWNADMTELTFRLNTAAHWSDGTPVTAEDVAYTFATNVKIGTGVDGYIDNIEAVDAHTVRVKAKLDENGKAVNPLMVSAYLSTNYVVQKTWTQTLEERTGGDMDAFFNDPANDFVSSGPYTLFFTDDTKVVLMRDDHYWGKNGSMWGVLPAPKYLAHIIYPDNESANTAFKTGLVDVSQMFIENVQDLWLVDHLPISTYLPDAPYNIGASLPTAFYNLNSPGLDQIAIRKAIAIAVDYDTIIANAMDNQSATFEQVPRSLMSPSAAEQALYDHAAVADLQWAGKDIAGAKALLDAAGIKDTNGDGWREYNGQTLHYVATCPNGWSDWQAAVEIIAASSRAIGIDVTTNYPEWDAYQNVVTNWPLPATSYDIFMMWSDGAGPTQPWGRIHKLIGSDYAGTSGNWSGNWGGYSNPAADALIQAIPAETDPATLKADYTELTRIYLTDVPSFTVMYHPQSFHTVNESIWTGFPKANDGTNPIVPPLDLTDGYSIAGLYNLRITPAAFNKIAPANGATGQPATVTLSWGASPNAKSHEYCYSTSDKNCNSWVSAGTTTGVTLSGLAPNTTYYWQVRAVNRYGTTYADGKKQALWSFKTGTVPASFNKTAPPNGATGQPANPTLTWAPSAGVTAYWYCYDTTNDGNCTTWFDNGTATSVTLSGLAKNTTYYWQVKAVNSFGTTYANGNKSVFWSFKTGTVPASFNKAAPTNGATGQPVNPTLSWGVSSGAIEYWYCFDTTNDNACTNWVNNGTTPRVTLSGLANRTTYYWQVKAVNSFGITYANGSVTAFWSFKTK